MTILLVAILFTLGVSAICSLLEAMILSTTTAEIEALKKTHVKRGLMLESYRNGIEETSSAILTLNTIANTLGATISGGLATQIFGQHVLLSFSIGMALGILFFSEIIPKNIGILYRPHLQPYLVYPLGFIRSLMWPFSWFCKRAIRILTQNKKQSEDSSDKEIMLLADKSAKEGSMTINERNLITNALNLNALLVSNIMTPRTVVMALDKTLSLDGLFDIHPSIPFARLPVYSGKIDNIVGMVRRKDLLKAKVEHDEATNEQTPTINTFIEPVPFIPDNVSVADALALFLKKHQQFGVVVDEFGSIAGVITLEDIFESLLGQEIFEKDDVAVDMREYALKSKKENSPPIIDEESKNN